MSIIAPKRNRGAKATFNLSFTDKDVYGVDALYTMH